MRPRTSLPLHPTENGKPKRKKIKIKHKDDSGKVIKITKVKIKPTKGKSMELKGKSGNLKYDKSTKTKREGSTFTAKIKKTRHNPQGKSTKKIGRTTVFKSL
jgi:hypothetical protein